MPKHLEWSYFVLEVSKDSRASTLPVQAAVGRFTASCCSRLGQGEDAEGCSVITMVYKGSARKFLGNLSGVSLGFLDIIMHS